MPPVHMTRLTPNSAKVKREAREMYKKLVEGGVMPVHGKRPTPKITFESIISTGTPEPPKQVEAVQEDYPVGTQALFIPWAKENLSFSSRKVCRELSIYPVQLTSSLTTKKNFQTKLLTSGETLRAPSGCFLFPQELSESILGPIRNILEDGELKIRCLIKSAFPSRTDTCVIPGDSAVFAPLTRAEVEDIEEICIPNRIYPVTLTGPISRDKVPCKIDYVIKDAVKQKQFRAPRLSLVITEISLASIIAEISKCEQETHDKIVAFLASGSTEGITSANSKEPFAQDDCDDLYDAPFEETDDFLDIPPSPEDDLGDAPGDISDAPPDFTPMDMHTENAYLRQMVADKKKIIELQNERYADIKRINHANVLISVVGTFSKALDDLLRDLAE